MDNRTKQEKNGYAEQARRFSEDPFVACLLRSIQGLALILDSDRRVLAVNEGFLADLNLEDPLSVLGLRPGQALSCEHANEPPSGCGSTEACKSCGAAISILAASMGREPPETDCCLRLSPEAGGEELILRVRARRLQTPNMPAASLILLCLRDVSAESIAMEMERAFAHDLSNIASSLSGAAELLEAGLPWSPLIKDLSSRLVDDIKFHRAIGSEGQGSYPLSLVTLRPRLLVESLVKTLQNHPAGLDKLVAARGDAPDVVTDERVLVRVLVNMGVNALEASVSGGEIRLGLEGIEGGWVRFSVWNQGSIPQNVRPRLFQRHFSTKGGRGRGLGSFVIKRFGEGILGGRVGYLSSDEEGTSFYLELPPCGPR